uniref:Variant surface glycoprotein 584 n=1 Tax=Trypanosoma brucei TaxID=5691 RepID=M4T217_9TRYP|nr:variant surface glycoprotein 584 [Trypanosoma brucei]
MQQRRGAQIEAFLIALLPALAAASSINLHNRKAQLITPCDTSHYAVEMGKQVTTALRTALTRAKEATQTACKLHLLTAALAPTERLAAAILAGSAAAVALEAVAAIEAASEDFSEGLSALAELGGTQLVVAEMLKSKIEDAATIGRASATSTPDILKIKPKIVPATKKACHTDQDAPTKTPNGSEEAAGNIRLKIFSLKAETPGTTHNGKLTLCGHGSAGQNPGTSGVTCTNDQTNLGIKGGNFVVQHELSSERTEANTKISYGAVTSADTIPNGATLTKQLQGIAKLENAVSALQKVTTMPTTQELAKGQEIKDAVARALGGEKASYTDKKIQKQVDELLTAVFGKDESTVTGVIVKGLNKLKPPKAAFNGAGSTTLEQITEPNQIADATTYYIVRSYINGGEQKKKNQENPSCPTKTEKAEEPPKTVDECKKHKTSEDCKKETGCDFDEKKDPKCFPKVEAEKEDEKSFSSNLRVSVTQVFLR